MEKLRAFQQSAPNPALVHCFEFDADDWEQTTDAVEKAASELGDFDAVINCAGIFRDPISVEQMTKEELPLTLAGNFYTSANVTIASIPYLKARKGSIVNVAATDAFAATAGYAAEGASKAALVAFSAHAAVDLGRYGIRVNVVAPGWVKTPMSEPALQEMGVAGEGLAVPLIGRIGGADEVAEVIRFLASEKASYISGTTVVVDGGHLAVMSDVR
jgi:3-oxoacyl-[acyl-carrier protein] reductase